VPLRRSPSAALARRLLARAGLSWLSDSPDAYRPWIRGAVQASSDLIGSSGAGRLLVTFASPMSDHLVGLELRKRFPGLRWAAYFGDPWARNPMARRRGFDARRNLRLEDAVVSAADLLLFPCQEMADSVLAPYPLKAKDARIVTHGWEEGLYPAGQRPRDEGLRLLHAGSLYGSRSPGDLLQALGILAVRSPSLLDGVRVEFAGPGSDIVESLSGGLPKGLVTSLGGMPYLQSLAAMRAADALLLIEPSDPGSGVFLPSKLVDYIGAGRPVLAVCGRGAARRVVESLGGWTSPHGAPSATAASLSSLLEWLRASRGDDRPWGAAGVRSGFEASSAGRAFAGCLAELASQ